MTRFQKAVFATIFAASSFFTFIPAAHAGYSVFSMSCEVNSIVHTKSSMTGFVHKADKPGVYLITASCDSWVAGGQTAYKLPAALVGPGVIKGMDFVISTTATWYDGSNKEITNVEPRGTKTGHLDDHFLADPLTYHGSMQLYMDIHP